MLSFELFLGARSLGTIRWENGGWIHLRINDPDERRFLLEYFQGPLSRSEAEDVRFRPDGLTAGRFEAACAELRRRRGYQVASRPAGASG